MKDYAERLRTEAARRKKINGGSESIITIGTDEATDIADELERLRELEETINKLRGDRATVITLHSILYSNSEESEEVVNVAGYWTDYQTKRFSGKTMIDALQAALAFKEAAQAGE